MSAAHVRYEYRTEVIGRGRPEVLVGRLNARGQDGWQVAAVVPTGSDLLVIWERPSGGDEALHRGDEALRE
jgi:hypothetical protein